MYVCMYYSVPKYKNCFYEVLMYKLILYFGTERYEIAATMVAWWNGLVHCSSEWEPWGIVMYGSAQYKPSILIHSKF